MNAKDTRVPPIEMTEHFFTKVNISAAKIDIESLDSGKPFGQNIKRSYKIGRIPESTHCYQVLLNIKSEEKENYILGYDLDVDIVGLFEVDNSIDDSSRRDSIAGVLGSTLLYSAARDFIYSLTLRGPWEAVYLPTVSFIPSEATDNEQQEMDDQKLDNS